MLGYSDSGKDAGRLAANWALYRCQEQLVRITKEAGIALTLFHGRGGTVGRGGGPTYLAIQSQAPGSVEGSFRITEQGEMVQAKFGIPVVAANQMELYSTAVLLASTKPPRAPRSRGWVEIMDALGKDSCNAYRCAGAAWLGLPIGGCWGWVELVLSMRSFLSGYQSFHEPHLGPPTHPRTHPPNP